MNCMHRRVTQRENDSFPVRISNKTLPKKLLTFDFDNILWRFSPWALAAYLRYHCQVSSVSSWLKVSHAEAICLSSHKGGVAF